ncbi:hypothetical protein BGZ83_006148 [Gryganskiella cystojenkinii]|nr:hypothetical protein BGZ83_006148 [Gryganskiella cystojenkinii]
MSSGNNDPTHRTPYLKGKHHGRHNRSPELRRSSSNDTIALKPTARNTPMITFQPHHTEISTDRPSVSGRLLLHIPKIPFKKFHFVSMTLHLRLKEAIGWTRQDLVTFELEKQGWSQTVWDKNIQLAFQDRQVEEGDGVFVAVVKEPSKNTDSEGLGKGRIEIPADEWRWEWLLPVTEQEVRPESFEGSMGNVWYELEAKCLFRWDDVDQNGNMEDSSTVRTAGSLSVPSEPKAGLGLGRVQNSSSNLLKGLEGSTTKAKSFVNAFGKLRVGHKSKKIKHSGDFKVGSQHDEFVKQSLQKRTQGQAAEQSTYSREMEANEFSNGGDVPLQTSFRGHSTPQLSGDSSQADQSSAPEALPFLIRKVLKLYFIKPPPNTSSNPSFFLPPPSMALPTLPGTRRLKAIIPGARIQVQIQVPSLIPIRGYAQTSQLVPDPKKGGLVLTKQSQHHSHPTVSDFHHGPFDGHGSSSQHPHEGLEVDSRYLDNFQVALTVRKVTQQDINRSEHLKRRYQNAGASPALAPYTSTATSVTPGRKRVSSGPQPFSSTNPENRSVHGSGGEPRGVISTSATNSSSGAEARIRRKDIRVRKVKCEFWQKESCRIPTSTTDSGSRTIKFALAPAFTYSDKEQERDRIRSSLQLQRPQELHQQSTNGFWESGALAGLGDLTKKEPSSPMPSSPILKPNSFPAQRPPSSPIQSPAFLGGQRKHSNASLYNSPVVQPTPTATLVGSGTAGAIRSSPLTLAHSGNLHPSTPFMLLIPVPLDSPRLRQTFSWPSIDTPSPVRSKSSDLVSMPYPPTSRSRSSSSPVGNADGNLKTKTLYDIAILGAGGGISRESVATIEGGTVISGSSESGTTTSDGLQETERSRRLIGGGVGSLAVRESESVDHVAGSRADEEDLSNVGTSSREPRRYHNGDGVDDVPSQQSSRLHASSTQHAAVRSRIEVKHYLSFRLSIDMLEYEGEFEQDCQDLDLEAIEEHQLQLIKIRQELSAYGSNMGMGSNFSAAGGEPCSLKKERAGIGLTSRFATSEGTSSSVSDHTTTAASINTTTSSGSNNVLALPVLPVSNSPTTMQPALSFLSSTAGLLDPGTDFHIQRRPSGAGATSSMSSHSGNSTKSTGGAISGPAALVAGALSALKKKSSSSALGNMVNVAANSSTETSSNSQQKQQDYSRHHPQLPQHAPSLLHRRTRSSAVHVQRLKDFVIRVPITVVIQVNDLSRVGTTSRVAASSGTGTQDRHVGEGETSTDPDRDYSSGDGVTTSTKTDGSPTSTYFKGGRSPVSMGQGGAGGEALRSAVQGRKDLSDIHRSRSAEGGEGQSKTTTTTAVSNAESASVMPFDLGSERKSSTIFIQANHHPRYQSSPSRDVEEGDEDEDDAEYVEGQFIPDHM